MRWILLLLLFLPLSSSAAVLRICNMGDTQMGAQCDNATTAWEHLEASVDWIVANPEQCDVVIWPGDLVDGYGWNKAGDNNWVDCWCLSQLAGAVDCTEHENPLTERTCYATECNDTEAKACAGGTAGHYCEQTRIRGLLDKLVGAGVPYITVNGNHDGDEKGTSSCDDVEYTKYNEYFGKGKMSEGFSETGVLETTLPCAAASDGTSEQADASYHVLRADGADWLFLAIPWIGVEYGNVDAVDQPGMSNEVLAWFLEVIADHPRMPTIPITHAMVSNDCEDAEETSYEDVWCANLIGGSWDNKHTGKPVYDSMMSLPQVVFTIGSHIRELFYAVSGSTTHRVLGAAADYTGSITGAPAWQSTDYIINGGGGVVTLWRIDTVTGVISSKAYSDEESAWVGVYNSNGECSASTTPFSCCTGAGTGTCTEDEGSNWKVQMPMCTDDVRFSFPAAACPERVFTPSVNLGSIRKR